MKSAHPVVVFVCGIALGALASSSLWQIPLAARARQVNDGALELRRHIADDQAWTEKVLDMQHNRLSTDLAFEQSRAAEIDSLNLALRGFIDSLIAKGCLPTSARMKL